MRHVRLYNLAKTSFDMVRHKNRATRVTYLHDLEARRKKWASRPAYLMSVERWAGDERYERLLREYLTRIRSVAANHGAPLVVLLIPDVSQLFHPDVQYINRLLGGLAREQAIAFVDMTPIFERSPGVREYYLWPLDAHVNGRGHREMARALVEPVCRALAANRVTCATTAATRAALQ